MPPRKVAMIDIKRSSRSFQSILQSELPTTKASIKQHFFPIQHLPNTSHYAPSFPYPSIKCILRTTRSWPSRPSNFPQRFQARRQIAHHHRHPHNTLLIRNLAQRTARPSLEGLALSRTEVNSSVFPPIFLHPKSDSRSGSCWDLAAIRRGVFHPGGRKFRSQR